MFIIRSVYTGTSTDWIFSKGSMAIKSDGHYFLVILSMDKMYRPLLRVLLLGSAKQKFINFSKLPTP